jgi:hypothetical protein
MRRTMKRRQRGESLMNYKIRKKRGRMSLKGGVGEELKRGKTWR